MGLGFKLRGFGGFGRKMLRGFGGFGVWGSEFGGSSGFVVSALRP